MYTHCNYYPTTITLNHYFFIIFGNYVIQFGNLFRNTFCVRFITDGAVNIPIKNSMG
jgi:hypothetical protein